MLYRKYCQFGNILSENRFQTYCQIGNTFETTVRESIAILAMLCRKAVFESIANLAILWKRRFSKVCPILPIWQYFGERHTDREEKRESEARKHWYEKGRKWATDHSKLTVIHRQDEKHHRHQQCVNVSKSLKTKDKRTWRCSYTNFKMCSKREDNKFWIWNDWKAQLLIAKINFGKRNQWKHIGLYYKNHVFDVKSISKD